MKPVLQALLLADKIYSDAATQKKIIAGTFSRLVIVKGTDQTPSKLTIPAGGMRAGSPFAYISITNIHGEAKLVLRYTQLSDAEQKVLFQAELSTTCDDPLRTVEIVVPLPVFPPIKGVFALEVLCDSELLGSHRIVVEEQEMSARE